MHAGDDFYRYAEGHWLDTNKIPPDRTRWGSFDELDERAQQQVLGIVQGLPADAPEGSNAQKVGDYYRAFIDTAAIEQRGLEPARAGIDAITQAQELPGPDAPHGTPGPGAQGAAARGHLRSTRRTPTATP